MKKEAITNLLESKHQELFTWLEEQPKDNWEKGPQEKWTTSQHILHLADSLEQLNKALKYPKFLLKYKFGTCNREIRDYETVANNYEEKLKQNLEKAKKFNQDLPKPSLEERQNLLAKLQKQNQKLQRTTKKIKDKHLDTLLLPHPLIGRMTLREIIMWTAHHTEHHTEILKKNY